MTTIVELPTVHRNVNALAISDGACNPSRIAHSLVEALDEITGGTDVECADAAVRLIASRLAFLVGVWDGVSPWHKSSFSEAREACRESRYLESAESEVC
jgi:hypothetical protein